MTEIFSENKIILFDGVCNFCNSTVRFVIKRDKKEKFKFASLQSEFGQNVLNKFNISQTDFNTFILISEQKTYIKSRAALIVLYELGGFWKIISIFKIIPIFITDYFYDIVSKYRYKFFGKKDVCSVPEKNISHRFIS